MDAREHESKHKIFLAHAEKLREIFFHGNISIGKEYNKSLKAILPLAQQLADALPKTFKFNEQITTFPQVMLLHHLCKQAVEFKMIDLSDHPVSLHRQINNLGLELGRFLDDVTQYNKASPSKIAAYVSATNYEERYYPRSHKEDYSAPKLYFFSPALRVLLNSRLCAKYKLIEGETLPDEPSITTKVDNLLRKVDSLDQEQEGEQTQKMEADILMLLFDHLSDLNFINSTLEEKISFVVMRACLRRFFDNIEILNKKFLLEAIIYDFEDHGYEKVRGSRDERKEYYKSDDFDEPFDMATLRKNIEAIRLWDINDFISTVQDQIKGYQEEIFKNVTEDESVIDNNQKRSIWCLQVREQNPHIPVGQILLFRDWKNEFTKYAEVFLKKLARIKLLVAALEKDACLSLEGQDEEAKELKSLILFAKNIFKGWQIEQAKSMPSAEAVPPPALQEVASPDDQYFLYRLWERFTLFAKRDPVKSVEPVHVATINH